VEHASETVKKLLASEESAKAEASESATLDTSKLDEKAKSAWRDEIPDRYADVWRYSPNVKDLDDLQLYCSLVLEGCRGAHGKNATLSGKAQRRRLAKRSWLDLDFYRRCMAAGLKPLARLISRPAPAISQLFETNGDEEPVFAALTLTPLEVRPRLR
jgi:hypothetical protein